MTIQDQDLIDAWLNGTAEDKEREIEATKAWFQKHAMAGRITGGEELGWPSAAKTVRKKGITDGPFVEKELLGGFIVVEVASEAEAIEMAREWPGLAWDDDAVEVRPAGSAEEEASAQREGASG